MKQLTPKQAEAAFYREMRKTKRQTVSVTTYTNLDGKTEGVGMAAKVMDSGAVFVVSFKLNWGRVWLSEDALALNRDQLQTIREIAQEGR